MSHRLTAMASAADNAGMNSVSQLPPGAAGATNGAVTPLPIDAAQERARWWANVRQKAYFGLAVSLVVHLLVLAIAAVITVGIAQAGGAGDQASGEIELAVMTEAELAELTGGALGGEAPLIPDAPLEEAPTDVPLETDAEAVVGDLGDAGEIEGLSKNLAGGGDVSTGGMGESGSGSGAATFFGVEARGNRFAYIVDVSGSMTVGGKIEALKGQLAGSINALLQNASFFVAAFSTDAYALGGEVKWWPASDDKRSEATRGIAGMRGDGGTEPLPGFKMVYALRPKPDAIYFMTDGEFDPDVEIQIRRMNIEWKIPIHCICFVSNASEDMMKRIAKDSGGTYSYVKGIGP